MVRNNRVKIAFILLFFLNTFFFSQDKQVDEKKQLREEILDVYESGGDQRLLDFVKKKKDKIPNTFIVDFAKAGVIERKEEWLMACNVMAGEKQDEKTTADVSCQTGRYFMLTGDNKKAANFFDKAFSIYLKLNDPIGQGNVYMNKGTIYLYGGNNPKALEMYNKALSFYKKTGDIESKSNVLHYKARILAKLGKNEKSLNLFEQGITNQEKVRTQTAFSEMKRNFMERIYEQYEETVLFMLENKYYEKGFKYAESMRARVFLDRMAEGLVPLEKGLKPELRKERNQLVVKLSNISKEMHKTSEKEEKKSNQRKRNRWFSRTLFSRTYRKQFKRHKKLWKDTLSEIVSTP